MRRGSTRLLRLSSRETLKTGPGGGPVLYSASESPNRGTAEPRSSNTILIRELDVWAAETDRAHDVKGGSKEPPFLLPKLEQ